MGLPSTTKCFFRKTACHNGAKEKSMEYTGTVQYLILMLVAGLRYASPD